MNIRKKEENESETGGYSPPKDCESGSRTRESRRARERERRQPRRKVANRKKKKMKRAEGHENQRILDRKDTKKGPRSVTRKGQTSNQGNEKKETGKSGEKKTRVL